MRNVRKPRSNYQNTLLTDRKNLAAFSNKT